MKDTPDWLSLGDLRSEWLLDTRLQTHHAAQALAAFGQSFLEARADDSHRSMTWDPEQERFWSEAAADGTRAAVGFEPLALHVVAGNGWTSSLTLMGVTLATMRAWLEKAVREVDGWGDAELSWPDYDMPAHPVSSGTPFEPHPRAQRALIAWYTNAERLIRESVHPDQTPDASPIRVWPHHFDMASLVTVERGDNGDAEKTIGIGLSPGDPSYDDPYFYVTVWPHPDTDDLPPFEGPGYWHTKSWVGLVLPAAKLSERGDDEEQADAARAFMSRAYGLAQEMLS